MKIEAFVISWEGKQDAALKIANEICTLVDTTVIDSNIKEEPYYRPSSFKWIHVPNSFFYGLKFSTCLDLLSTSSYMLQIQADAQCDDWPKLIDQLKIDLKDNPSIGVWSPLIKYTPYDHEYVYLSDISNHLSSVIQTDGIVWAIDYGTCEKLKEFNYHQNNLGWGIDWAAICICRSTNKLVTCNKSLLVNHPRGSGYNTEEASKQMDIFLSNMSTQEKDQYKLLHSTYIINRKRIKKMSIFSRFKK